MTGVHRFVASLLTLLSIGVGSSIAASWSGDSREAIVPTTLEARLSDTGRKILYKTPMEFLKPQTLTLNQGTGAVRLTVTEVRKGKLEDQLWEFRFEPGEAYSAGTWVVFRDGLGRFREIRLIILGAPSSGDHRTVHNGTWIRMTPVPGVRNTRVDLFLAGRFVAGDWQIPVPLEDISQQSEEFLWSATSKAVDWPLLVPSHRWEDERVDDFQKAIHKALSGLSANAAGLWLTDPSAGQNGADANGRAFGRWQNIPGTDQTESRGLSGWGVTLWVTQGVLSGWNGTVPPLKDLFVERSNLPGYSKALQRGDPLDDPAFSLDWNRNLALSVMKQRMPKRPLADDSADVKDLPLIGWVENAGYDVDDFGPLCHLLAVTRPGKVYLASLSSQILDQQNRSSSVNFQEPVVLIPWIGADNAVRVAIFLGPKEVSWEEWIAASLKKRSGVRPDHVMLVELPVPETIRLPLLPAR